MSKKVEKVKFCKCGTVLIEDRGDLYCNTCGKWMECSDCKFYHHPHFIGKICTEFISSEV